MREAIGKRCETMHLVNLLNITLGNVTPIHGVVELFAKRHRRKVTCI